MNNFLDSCVIIANFDEIEKYHKVTRNFIDKNKNFIISEFQKQKEIPNLFNRKTRILLKYMKAIIQNKIPTLTSFHEKKEMRNLLLKYSKHNPTIEELKMLRILLRQIQNDVMRFTNSIKVLPTQDPKSIKRIAKEFKIENIPDSIIITYAILEHQKNIMDLITLDKRWDRHKIKKVCNKHCLKIPKVIHLDRLKI